MPASPTSTKSGASPPAKLNIVKGKSYHTLSSEIATAEAALQRELEKQVAAIPSGGTNDVLARIVGDRLQAKWGQPVIIENCSGGSGNIGAAPVAQAEPDGYTLLVSATPPLATNQSLYKDLSYKPDEFVPITNFGSVPNLVIVRKGLPVNSLSELIAYAKANPGKLVYGSQGAGNTPHLTGNMFMNMTGTSMVHVPYRGETLVYNDMLGERVDVFFGNISGAFALYRDGKLKVLAVTDKARAAAMPDVPTSAEVGLPGLLGRLVRDGRTTQAQAGTAGSDRQGHHRGAQDARCAAALSHAQCRAGRKHACRNGRLH
jgi:tripartite-type tricarboxylate transporter receptor subunit TctC